MRNVLIFAGLAGIAAAVAIYFVSEANKDAFDYVDDAADDAYDTMNEHVGKVERKTRKAFHSMS